MEHIDGSYVSLPANRNYEYAYNQSFKLASNLLAANDNLTEICRKSSTTCWTLNNIKTITLDYLNETYRVLLPEVAITKTASVEAVPIRDRIIILHYLLTAKGTPLSGQAITFKELPEGTIYFRTFFQRTIKNIIATFGTEPEKLLAVGEKIGGKQADFGDAAVTVPALPMVPITFVIWRGDEEFGAEGNVLYDKTITDYLPTEDIIVLTETVTWKLVHTKQ